jgi:tRNA U34 5-methylaminomethyl-2-thiouridine-forming methyltransferase MnmC
MRQVVAELQIPQNQLRVVETADGSPSIDMQITSERSEWMHSREGALTESLYIYLEAFQFVANRHWPLSVASVGLGLGYNEMILAAYMIQEELKGAIHVESFESHSLLREAFRNWVLQKQLTGIPAPLLSAYDQMADQIGEHFKVPPPWIKARLAEWLQEGQWRLRGALDATTAFDQKFTCILYDAFSNKASPELWEEEFLAQTLAHMAADQCVLSTYAATGSLNRVLRNLGFLLEDKKGFAGKRESTFAVRIFPRTHSLEMTD